MLVGIVWSRGLASSEAKGNSFIHFKIEMFGFMRK